MPQNPGQTNGPSGPLLAQKIVQIPKQKQGQQDGDPKMYRGNKIKLDRLSKQDTAVLQAVPDQKGKLGKVDNYAIVEVEPHEGSPTQRNKV